MACCDPNHEVDQSVSVTARHQQQPDATDYIDLLCSKGAIVMGGLDYGVDQAISEQNFEVSRPEISGSEAQQPGRDDGDDSHHHMLLRS